MNAIVKTTAAIALAGALATAAATPGFARDGRYWGAAGAGFAAGAIVGAAAANANARAYYGPGYYGPGYAYAPAYDSYAYESGYVYTPRPAYGNRGTGEFGHGWRPSCATDGNYNASDYSAC